MLNNPFVPQKPTSRQTAFLLDVGLEAFFGGAAGPGKSSALLMAALQFVDIPRYSAIIFRRTFKDLSLPGALMDRANEWLSGTAAKWSGQEKRWTFPSGATLSFGYLESENDKYRYQSSEFAFCAFDELTQFSETQYSYLFSRLRRLKESNIPIRMRSASNPGGVGHEWVKGRFIGTAKHYVAKMADNPHIDRVEYDQALAHLDPITRDQLRKGDWDAFAGGRFKREWLQYYIIDPIGQFWMFGDVAYEPREIVTRFLTVDPAATVAEVTSPDPDWTAISAWGVTKCGKLAWLDCERYRCEIPDIAPKVAAMYARWGASIVEIEGGGTQKGVYQLCQRHPSHMNCVEFKPTSDKLDVASDILNVAEAKRLWLPANAPWFPRTDVESELLRFTGDSKVDAHDDIVTTASIAGKRMGRRDARPKHIKMPGVLKQGMA